MSKFLHTHVHTHVHAHASQGWSVQACGWDRQHLLKQPEIRAHPGDKMCGWLSELQDVHLAMTKELWEAPYVPECGEVNTLCIPWLQPKSEGAAVCFSCLAHSLPLTSRSQNDGRRRMLTFAAPLTCACGLGCWNSILQAHPCLSYTEKWKVWAWLSQ